MQQVVTLLNPVQLRIGLQLVRQDVVVGLLLCAVLALQLVLLFEGLVDGRVVDGLVPVVLAQVHVAEQTVNGALVGDELGVELS